jgi:phosphatidate cytidylyltransferase
MGIVALWLTWLGGWAFALLAGVAAVIMIGEWRLLVLDELYQVDTALSVAGAAGAVILAAYGHPVLGLVLLLVVAAAVLMRDRDRPIIGLGVLYAGAPALALVWMRGDATHGFAAVLYVFLVVWITDVAAFTAGRLVGGPRLAPTVSPGKTWSGLAGGVLAAMLAGGIFGWFVEGGSPRRLMVLAGLLALASQAGDLAESVLKRRFGRKDASNLIPGHGGLLDRVDGLVTATILCAVLALALAAAHPGRAVLLGS